MTIAKDGKDLRKESDIPQVNDEVICSQENWQNVTFCLC